MFILTSISLYGQADASLKAHYHKILDNALKVRDSDAAIHALHGIIALDSNILYKDTLSMLYFSNKAYYSALVLAEEVVRKAPSNVEAYGRAAECYQYLGEFKTAVNYFEQIAAVTKSPYYLYKLAVAQYSLKRLAECEDNCKKVIADTTAGKIGVLFVNTDGTDQLIPVSAAAKNLAGVIYMEAKNYAEAVRLFKDALTIFPQFAGASDNLKACESAMMKEKKK
jgi:tetratricopeptide (TPR) repeat protein